MTRRRGTLIALAVLALGLAAYEAARINGDLRPHDLHGVDHVGSEACRECHKDRHRTWARTFHRTMTQEADDDSVLGAFDGRTLRYGGVTARMDRARDGAHRMTFSAAGRASRSVNVVRTVGSHRYQQYLAREGDAYVRLPIAWHVEEARFVHMNGAFLTLDPDEPLPGAAISDSDYDRHVTRWNDNCVFCHNVAPSPGLSGGRFRTTVAELGIACEACHGPGSEHVDARRDVVRSLALSWAQGEDGPDPTIVNPEHLSALRSAEVCGRCHGQRITDDIGRFLRDGDPFVPGDDLSAYSAPLARDTPLQGDPEAFAPRFWPDGTARLTAYELQGLLASACFVRGEGERKLTCTTCHGMHEGSPRGQLRPEARGDGACMDCHEELGTDAALEAHAHHPASSEGGRCVSCHMPRVVYGLVDVLRSHHIEIPDPARAAASGRPDACTLCHVDETRAWAVRAAGRLWPSRGAERETLVVEEVDEQSELTAFPESLLGLFGGDPIERAVAARSLARSRAPAATSTRARRLAALFEVMDGDMYPAVRHIAWRSARAVAPSTHGLDEYDPMGTRTERSASLDAARRALAEDDRADLDPNILAALRARASRVAIEIGE